VGIDDLGIEARAGLGDASLGFVVHGDESETLGGPLGRGAAMTTLKSGEQHASHMARWKTCVGSGWSNRSAREGGGEALNEARRQSDAGWRPVLVYSTRPWPAGTRTVPAEGAE
jgi:hypothetical protein